LKKLVGRRKIKHSVDAISRYIAGQVPAEIPLIVKHCSEPRHRD
jgi:hypothetical protein